MRISPKPCPIERFRWNFWNAGYLHSGHPNFQKTVCLAQNGGHFEFSNFSQKLRRVPIPIFKSFLFHPKWRPFWIFEFFAKIAKHKNAYILKTMLDRAISTKFLTHRVCLPSSHLNFQKNFVSPKMAAILNFQIFHKNCKIQKCLSRKSC